MHHISIFSLSLLLCTIATHALDKVEITIDQQYISYLDKNPYYDTTFIGNFTSNDSNLYEQTKLSYRGAYSLYNQIKFKLPQRNWKVKVPKDNPYREYRVWNYNYEPFLTHNLVYKLMRDALVPCIQMRQVVLFVNTTRYGLYSEFQDPDNLNWLKKTFGNSTDNFVGDLYKVATDKPNLTQKYFGDLTILGDNDSNYYLHYIKKTNDSTEQAANDYSSIRFFIKKLNETPDEQFADTIDKYFDVPTFLRYLVVANYSNFWDGYPNRAKNYWLYRNPSTGKWVFIPWDLDATFNPIKANYNNMGTECNYMFMHGETDLNKYYTKLYSTSDNGRSEITPRPLFTRIMSIKKFRDLYATEYKQALSTYLNKESILKKIDSIAGLLRKDDLPTTDLLEIDTSVTDTRLFVERRTASLEQQLSAIAGKKQIKQNLLNLTNLFFIKMQNASFTLINNYSNPVTCDIYQVNGKIHSKINLLPHSVQTVNLRSGCGVMMYEIRANTGGVLSTGRVIVK